MPKKYHLDQNEIAFIHCTHGAFAGMYAWTKLIEGNLKKTPKKKLLEAFQSIITQTDTALTSEYIRGELIKKGVLENGGGELCTFDPLGDNTDAEVYTKDEVAKIRLDQLEPKWKDAVKGR